jgi:crotonobetainyl-CoA:carnitine CoA-transferase CaiB-like acyl-CoA transferase
MWPADDVVRVGPLCDLRVLDLSQVLAGPFATMQLSDLGADVIKVERAGVGDETRRFGPPFMPDGTATYFLAANRDKRSITLDLTDPRSVAIARRMALAADVVVDNYLPGRLARFGLDSDGLRAENSALITATVTSFGRDNEYAGRPGFDFLAQAMGGLMAVTGQPRSEPTRVGVAIADIAAGLYLSQSILAALVERNRSGSGSHVEIALLDVQVALLVNLASAWLEAGHEAHLFGNAHPNISPYETFPTSDDTIAIAVGTDPQFRRLAAALRLDGLADDPLFTTNADRVRNREKLRPILAATFMNRTSAAWVSQLVTADVPVAPVNSLPDVFADPVVRDRMVGAVEGVSQVLTPIRIDGRQPLPNTAPPRLGAHTNAILLSLGVTEHEIERLKLDHAI